MPDYDFKTLSPSDFEQLVRDLLLADRGWRLEAFGHGQDGGVDLRGMIDGKKIVIQCKHYAGSAFADLRKSARKEVPKMKAEKPDRYLFVTSQSLSRTQKDALGGDLEGLIANPADIITQLDLNEAIGRHYPVERSNFKLWLASAGMLETIVRSGLWARSEALLEDVSDRVKLYVSNPGYIRASKKLNEAHVVVLSGVPGVGKSMLAEMLLLNHWHEGWQVVAVSSDIDEAWESIKPTVRQIFLYDDFLGQTDISERNKNEDTRLVRFMEKVARDPTKRLVMTTRSQVLRQAALAREPISRGNFRVRECVVVLSDYGLPERARILYNHLYFSDLPRYVIRDYALNGHYWKVIRHRNFSPRIIEQVIRQGGSDARQLAGALDKALDRPIELWGKMFSTVLSEVAQRIVLSLVTFAVDGASPDDLKAVALRDSTPISYTNALKALEGTFLSIDPGSSAGVTRLATKPSISFANPSVRDFVLATLDEEPEYVRTLTIAASGISQLVNLAQYAASEAAGRRQFPGIAQALSENSRLILNQIQHFVAGTNIDSAWKFNNEVLRPLSELLTPAAVLFPLDALGDIVGVMRDLIKDHHLAAPDGDIWERFIKAEVNLRQNDGELHDLLTSWGSVLETVDDVQRFGRFIDEQAQSLPHVATRAHFAQPVSKALENDIDNISLNRQDEDTDLGWLSQIEEAAADFGVVDQMSVLIESERDSIITHYAEQEEEESWSSIPTSGAGYFGSSGSKAGDPSNSIANLFNELT